MAIGNGELVQECFHKHSRMGTRRLYEERREYEKTEGGHERKVPTAYHYIIKIHY